MFVLCLIILVSLSPAHGWDQLGVTAMMKLFPFVPMGAVTNITEEINRINGTQQTIDALNAWIDKSWVQKPNVTTTPKPGTNSSDYDFGRLNEKEFARALAISFLEHREFVKLYLRVLMRDTWILQYFNQTELDKVNELFWRTDYYCYNAFSCTETNFYVKIGEEFSKTHKNVQSDLKLLTEPLHKFPKIAERLDWHYKKS